MAANPVPVEIESIGTIGKRLMIIIKLRKFCVAAFVMLAVASLLGTQAAQAGENTIIQASKRAYKVTAVVEPDLCIALSLGSCGDVGATGPAAAGNDFIVGQLLMPSVLFGGVGTGPHIFR